MRVCVYTPKKTRSSKLAESAFAREQLSTATRMLRSLPLHDLIGCRCPCLTCSVKIAQVGISEVVYSQEYNVDAKVCPDNARQSKH
jgi:deoxycytidylate deaminase